MVALLTWFCMYCRWYVAGGLANRAAAVAVCVVGWVLLRQHFTC